MGLIFYLHKKPKSITPIFKRSETTECICAKHTIIRSLVRNKVAVTTLGDGNCLFHALSLIMYGTEDYTLQVRLMTVIAMVPRKLTIKEMFCFAL